MFIIRQTLPLHHLQRASYKPKRHNFEALRIWGHGDNERRTC
jgi:hypothetical protein